MPPLEFSRKFSHLENLLFAFALSLTKNPDDARDLVQETAFRAYKNIDKFTIGTNFKSWLSTIMRNTFINQYRKAKRRRKVNEPVDSFLFAVEDKVLIPNQGELNIRMQEYNRLFAELSDIYSIPFLLFYRGYEYKEIAEVLDIPVGTVKSRIFLARKKLKAKIRALYE
ncbi:MAG: RNA polymerase sigma factor [Phaeodactylibacter sp.]|nr:RNA polymerase sigma factor [Phaeodactylibacter sp.]MCB9276874.1 RNA polymerase sigma factor [Lewinellaceae bacterium]